MTETETKQQAVWSDEDGNYIASGHLDFDEFKRMALACDVECLGADHDSDNEGCGKMNPDQCRHEYWRPSDHTDEWLELCSQSHPEARPYTVWRH